MARRGENIYRRKDGRYEGRYVIGRTREGHTRFGYVYGRQYYDVRHRLLLKKSEQLLAPEALKICGRGTYGDWLREWLENDIRPNVKESTWQCYQRMAQRYLFPLLGNRRIDQLSLQDAKGFVHSLRMAGLAPRSVKGIVRLFSASMHSALEEGLIRKNPCRKLKLEHETVAEQRVLTSAEQKVVHDAAMERQSLETLLALYAGLRVGEVCGLRWEDVDWRQGTIRIRRTVQRIQCRNGERKTALAVGTPKSVSSSRTIVLPAFIMDMLRPYKNCKGYMFGADHRPADPRTMQKRCASLMKRIGISGVHFHTLRHSFATRLFELGVDIKTVSELLGHSSARITLECYAHSTPAQRIAAIERLEKAML